jgi:hypothetical protein
VGLPSRGGIEYQLSAPPPLPWRRQRSSTPMATGTDPDDLAFVCEGRYYLYEHAPYRVRRYHATYAEPGAFLRACASSFFEVPLQTARYHDLFARALELREIRLPIGAGVQRRHRRSCLLCGNSGVGRQESAPERLLHPPVWGL